MDDVNDLLYAGWEAHSAMLNRAQELERAAKELRESARKLYQALDPAQQKDTRETLAKVVEGKK